MVRNILVRNMWHIGTIPKNALASNITEIFVGERF